MAAFARFVLLLTLLVLTAGRGARKRTGKGAGMGAGKGEEKGEEKGEQKGEERSENGPKKGSLVVEGEPWGSIQHIRNSPYFCRADTSDGVLIVAQYQGICTVRLEDQNPRTMEIEYRVADSETRQSHYYVTWDKMIGKIERRPELVKSVFFEVMPLVHLEETIMQAFASGGMTGKGYRNGLGWIKKYLTDKVPRARELMRRNKGLIERNRMLDYVSKK
ncbi:hypothetical protein FOZ63_024163 [Perkinsus olseni]|uniref:Uncharacterized protein n=1 Tax=Perkinsus olseni TaxID=32597 RepID=A0A7J6UDX6_PEROL|nr:hypothetical protein FOZ63_024163 [Perkinsus olseni]